MEAEPELEAQNPPDADGAVEEEQRVDGPDFGKLGCTAGELEPEPVPSELEEPAEPEVPEGHKLCKRCGPEVGPKHV